MKGRLLNVQVAAVHVALQGTIHGTSMPVVRTMMMLLSNAQASNASAFFVHILRVTFDLVAVCNTVT